jgi:septal ring factor EnvC (AmiA/AmiB activator)
LQQLDDACAQLSAGTDDSELWTGFDPATSTNPVAADPEDVAKTQELAVMRKRVEELKRLVESQRNEQSELLKQYENEREKVSQLDRETRHLKSAGLKTTLETLAQIQ